MPPVMEERVLRLRENALNEVVNRRRNELPNDVCVTVHNRVLAFSCQDAHLRLRVEGTHAFG